jgi:hypothetical protein
VDRSKERRWQAETNRIAGEIVLRSPGSDKEKAQAYFEKALSVAGDRQTKSWELRAAMEGRPAACLGVGRRCIMRRCEVQRFHVPAIDSSKRGITNVDGVLQHGVEYRLQITGQALAGQLPSPRRMRRS